MSEITRPLQLIEAEIRFYSKQTSEGMVEVGKRLVEAKDMIQHGEWENWLKEKVNFSSRTARRFMQVYCESLKWPALTDFDPSKIFALLDVPEDERQDFIESTHEINGAEKTVDEMSTRELQKVIKEKKEAEAKALKLQEERDEAILDRDHKEMENRVLAMENDNLKNKPPQTVEVKPSDYDTIKQTIERLQRELKSARQEASAYKDEAKAYKTSLENATTGGASFDPVSIVDFKIAVRNFLQQVMPLTLHDDLFAEMTPEERQAFSDEVETIEVWAHDFRETVQGSGKGVIYIEGGKNNGR